MKKNSKKFRKKIKTAEICLKNLARALDECEKNQLNCKMTHGIVVSKYGYVMPRKRGWVVRMLVESKFDDDGED